jgi:hypothetical protein
MPKFEKAHYDAIEQGGSVLVDGAFVTDVAKLRELDETPKDKIVSKPDDKKDK